MAKIKKSADTNDEVLLEEKQKIRLKKPSRYKVILINDDYTPQEFVVWVLANVFRKTMVGGYRFFVDEQRIALSRESHEDKIRRYVSDISRAKERRFS